MNEFLLIEAARSDRPRVMGLAYSGGKMNLPGWRHPVVVDLAGLELPESVPLLTNHENRTGSRVGLVRARVEDGSLTIEGEITSSNGLAQGIVEQAKAGADWQLSIGAEVRDAELVRGARVVNGQEHEGPFYHVKQSVLREVSVVAVGADAATRMRIAAKFNLSGGFQMNEFEKWLEKHGIKAEGLGEKRLAALKAAFESGEEPVAGPAPAAAPVPPAAPAKEDDETKMIAPPKPAPKDAAPEAGAQTVQAMAAARSEAQDAIRAERERVSAIQEICAGEYPQIEREAVKAGWSVEDTSQKVLKAMRENRPQADASISVRRGADRRCDSETLEAACVLAAGMTRPEDHYADEVLDRAGRRFRGGIGLQELILEAAWANGYPERTFRESREALRYAFAPDIRAAGLSSVNIGGILSNVANKFLLEGFYSVERVWRNICAVTSTSRSRRAGN